MDYPKRIMKISELVKHTGLSADYFLGLYRNPELTFAYKLDPLKRTSAVVIDTAEFEKYRLNNIKLEKRMLRERIGA